jgi:molybdenum cofactor cytidylyltransferase
VIGGILLAAGQSRRMGQPKLLLPWSGRPIIVHMVDLFMKAEVDAIVVVTGADREQIEASLEGLPILLTRNKEHAEQGMIGSVRAGLSALRESACEAALIMPADLPALLPDTLHVLMAEFNKAASPIIAPSFEGRRGHPVLVSRPEWNSILQLPEGHSLRDFLSSREDDVHHVVVDDHGILIDLDTPGDYEQGLSGIK